MASQLYNKAKQDLLEGNLNLSSQIIKVSLVKTAYTFSAADQDTTALGSNMVGTAFPLSSKTVTDGVFDAADATIVNSDSGSAINALVIWDDDVSDRLIAYIDNFTQFNTAGNNVVVTWNASGIFTL